MLLGAVKQLLLDFKRAPLRHAVSRLDQRKRFFERVVSPPLRAFEKLHPSGGRKPANGRSLDDFGARGLQANPHKRREGMGFAAAISPILLAEDDCVEIVLTPSGRPEGQQHNAGDGTVSNHDVNPQ